MWWPFRRRQPAPAPAPRVAPPAPDPAWRTAPQVRLSDDDPALFLVRCGDYFSPVLLSPDPWEKPFEMRLWLAFESSPGAELDPPRVVGHENVSGLLEDDFLWREWAVRQTAANAAALRAAGLTWADDAARAADALGVPEAAVEDVRRGMREKAARMAAVHDGDPPGA